MSPCAKTITLTALIMGLLALAPSGLRADCCELEAPDPLPAAPRARPWHPAGTYYNGASVYYGPKAYVFSGRPAYRALVRIHGWPVCYWGSGNEIWNGSHWVGPPIGFCD
jgi:hypothetical protein